MTKIRFLLPAARRATAIVVAAALAGALTATTVTTTATADPSAPYSAETITFQEGLVADEAEVSTQYATAYGVEFGTGSALGFPGAALDGIDDRSPLLLTNGYQGKFTSPVLASSARSIGAEPLGGEFPPPPAFMLHLDYARANLSFLVQAFAPGSSLNGGAEVIAYRADGTEVDQTTIDEPALGAWSTVTLSTTDPQGIQYLRVASLGFSGRRPDRQPAVAGCPGHRHAVVAPGDDRSLREHRGGGHGYRAGRDRAPKRVLGSDHGRGQ